MLDYQKTAQEIYEKLGGKENLISAAHCATRLRLVIADNAKCDNKAIEEIDGVKGVFFAAGQLQVILGTGVVDKVYAPLLAIAGISESSKEELKQTAAARTNIVKRAIKTLGDIFVPIIPAIVASGFLMGIMEALNFMVAGGFLQIDTSGSIYVFAKLFSNTAYTFLPILIGFSAAKVFGGNPFLGAVIGMIMIHPDLQNAWTVAAEGVQTVQPVFGGLYSIDLIGYQGHVIPVIIAAWVMAAIEKRLHKIVPASLDLFVTPLVSVFVTGYLTLAAIGPVFVIIENHILGAVQALIMLPFGIGSFVMGGLYAGTVVSGIHHMYTVIDMGQLSLYGLTYWLPLASAANVAQGGAALAVALRTKDKKLRSMALPASLSAFMGITEPAIFGVNLRFIRPFIAGAIGGACGALYASIVRLGATGTGVTGIFGILLHLHHPLQYIIAMLIALGVAFVVSWIIAPAEVVVAPKQQQPEQPAQQSAEIPAPQADTVYAPIEGKVVPLSEIPDPTFAEGIMGQGAAIIPADGKVYAPFEGSVVMVMPTKHAVCLQSEDGIEVLIHVGIDTVQMDGKGFTAHVAQGDHVQRGTLLLTADLAQITQAGYNTITPVIVTNSDDFAQLDICATGQIQAQNALLKLTRAAQEV